MHTHLHTTCEKHKQAEGSANIYLKTIFIKRQTESIRWVNIWIFVCKKHTKLPKEKAKLLPLCRGGCAWVAGIVWFPGIDAKMIKHYYTLKILQPNISVIIHISTCRPWYQKVHPKFIWRDRFKGICLYLPLLGLSCGGKAKIHSVNSLCVSACGYPCAEDNSAETTAGTATLCRLPIKFWKSVCLQINFRENLGIKLGRYGVGRGSESLGTGE